jgi:hypothetical protein
MGKVEPPRSSGAATFWRLVFGVTSPANFSDLITADQDAIDDETFADFLFNGMKAPILMPTDSEPFVGVILLAPELPRRHPTK